MGLFASAGDVIVEEFVEACGGVCGIGNRRVVTVDVSEEVDCDLGGVASSRGESVKCDGGAQGMLDKCLHDPRYLRKIGERRTAL